MGNSNCAIPEEDLEIYEELTCLTRQEILGVLKKFEQLYGNKITQENRRTVKISYEALMDVNELSVNPFRDRIAKVFSSSEDGELYFDDYLEMASVFSDNAPLELKIGYAFKVYDFNDDGQISKLDIKRLVDRLTGSKQHLSDDEMEDLIKEVLEESDLDEDEALSLSEFEHVMIKCPDFMTSFRARLF